MRGVADARGNGIWIRSPVLTHSAGGRNDYGSERFRPFGPVRHLREHLHRGSRQLQPPAALERGGPRPRAQQPGPRHPYGDPRARRPGDHHLHESPRRNREQRSLGLHTGIRAGPVVDTRRSRISARLDRLQGRARSMNGTFASVATLATPAASRSVARSRTGDIGPLPSSARCAHFRLVPKTRLRRHG